MINVILKDMLEQFFQLGPIPANALQGQYDARLVILSYVVATFASYIALDITGRLRDANNSSISTVLWLCGGAFAMGAGIWSMHFIGMLSFCIPTVPMNYDLYWTGFSMLVAILASGFALSLLKEHIIKVSRLALGGVILGLAIASMHYVGMHAMHQEITIHYLPGIFATSVIIAILASEVAITLALRSNQGSMRLRMILKTISAIVMGAAICGMHYTGMAAAVFTPMHVEHQHMQALDPQILAIAIAGVTFIVLGIAFFMSTYKEAMAIKQLETARQAGMAEVATSVLHNVGNILNSVNVSATIISEKITRSRLEGLSKLSLLLDENSDNLSAFLTQDIRGKQIPSYIKMLSTYWQEEQSQLDIETKTLIKNIDHIKNIILMQQELGKVVGLEQTVSMNDILDQALLITGLHDDKYGIEVTKEYTPLDPIYVDKVKLIQILVNLLRNAKDSVVMSPCFHKKITIKTAAVNANMFHIVIVDNGLGILPENITRIFSYGFTTKQGGHGFGLHSCALAANDMGGAIIATSDGVNKGATFTLELPYERTANKSKIQKHD